MNSFTIYYPYFVSHKYKMPKVTGKVHRKRTYRKRRYYKKSTKEFKQILLAPTIPMNSAGSVTLLNGLERGDDLGYRDGREVNFRSIEMKFSNFSTVGTGITQIHRMLLVQDKNPNATTPAILDILTGASSVATRNLNNRKRFKILWDKVVVVNGSGLSGTTRYTKKYKRLNIQTVYNQLDVNDITAIQQNALFLVCIGSSPTGTTAGTLFGAISVRFTE